MKKGSAALNQPEQTRVHRWWPFVLLLLAGASRWAVAAVRPDADSTLASEAIGCAWAALLSLTFLASRRQKGAPQSTSSRASLLRSFLAGAMLFGGPAVALLVCGRDLDPGGLTIALALTPVIIAIAAPAFGTESPNGIAGRIWPGLAAVAGLLLVLVQPTLGDLRTDLSLALAPVLAGAGAVLFCIDRPRTVYGVTVALFGAAALFAVALAQSIFAGLHPTISLLAVAGDGILALLGILTLAQLGATRWSSQFTWAPLLIILEGIVMVRPQLTAHWFIGLVLLAVSGVYLLLPQTDESSSSASPVPTLPR